MKSKEKKDDLVMYLAHDIRTPLTSVIGYLSLLNEVPDMPDKQREKYVGIALEKADRLQNMVNEFFEITRYDLNELHIHKTKIDLYYMLIQISDELYPLLSEKGNTIRLDVAENMEIYGDPEKLARAFNNVLKNAVSYSFNETEIMAAAAETEENVTVSFTNKGDEIPEEKRDMIFEKFYRSDESRISNNGEAGVGLAIAKEIISLHGGTIGVKSADHTVTFVITLPKSKL